MALGVVVDGLIGETRPMTKLILWDIDGTLVRAGDVAARVFDEAIEHVVGVRPTARIAMSGKTDPQIATEYLEALGITRAERLMPAILAELARLLASAQHEIAEKGSALDGAQPLIDRINAIPTIRQSVLTGNIAPNALVKLAAFGLDDHLDLEIGAFGSDHGDRRALVPVALGRVLALRGESIDPADVWIIGDAPNDFACARAGGVRCLLVATGRTPIDQLRALDPDAVVDDLSDTDALFALLTA